jgi:hypothetical protein
VLTLVEDPACRREMKRMRNLQEQRHGLGRKVFHGRKGEMYSFVLPDLAGGRRPLRNPDEAPHV